MDLFKKKLTEKMRIVDAAAGRIEPDLVLKAASYFNVFTNEIKTADIAVKDGIIAGLGSYSCKEEIDCTGMIVLPGFLDSHIHLESSLVAPSEFVRAVLPHGTTTVITDPHEIANVMGTAGIEYMLQATEGLPVDVHFMLPSCVPATPLDEAGAILERADLDPFYEHPRVCGLAEVMNYVGVAAADETVLSKLTSAELARQQIDGHAPDLDMDSLNAYAAAGVRSDHECHDLQDALSKLERGQHIMIREGTAARNLDALAPLICEKYAARCMFCSDDKHPSDLLEKGHIDYIIKRAINLGADPLIAVKIATLHAAQYFNLRDRGAIAPGYLADFVLIDNFSDFNIKKVFKRGQLLAEDGVIADYPLPEVDRDLTAAAHNTVHLNQVTAADFKISGSSAIIGMVNGEITTTDAGRALHPDPANDILCTAVLERHKNTGHIGLGLLKGYGLRSGAVATSISHDSHNIIVVGATEQACADAVNHLVGMNGGIVVWNDGKAIADVPLAIAGIMSDEPLETVNEKLENAKAAAYSLGVNPGIDPFMTLSFMALPVIPTLRLTTKGMFDVTRWQYI